MIEARLLTGSIRSGKTTALLDWAAGRLDVGGVASPGGPEGRSFLDLATGAARPMGPLPGDAADERIGPYAFASAAFAWATDRIRAACADPQVGIIAIDKLGPLESRGGGFAPHWASLVDAMRGRTLLVVIRTGQVEALVARLGLRLVGEGRPQDGAAQKTVP